MKTRKAISLLLALAICLCVVVPGMSVSAKGDSTDIKIENMSMGAGGAFYLPLINPVDGKNFVVASDMGGIYVSFNEGESWSRTVTKGVVKDSAFDDNGTLFLSGYGIYKSTDKGVSLERIYPKNIIYEISRAGWNENLFFAETNDGTYDNGYIVSIEPYGERLYFVSITWDGILTASSIDYNGGDLRTYYKKDYSSLFANPVGINARICVDDSGIYLSDSVAVYKLPTDETEDTKTVYTANGTVTDMKIIENNLFILDDTADETLILYTSDFLTFTNLNEKNTLTHDYTWDKNYVVPWHFNGIDGYSSDSIFLKLESTVGDDGYIFYGIVKFDGTQFNWVFDSVFENTVTENPDDLWSIYCYGPMYGFCADRTDPDRCLMTNIEAVYSMEYDKSENKRKIKTLHTKYNETQNAYSTTGLDCQTTYFVREDPFDSEHIIICSTDVGIQNSFDGGKTFSRPTGKSYSDTYNTCYDLFFDETQKDTVYALWSSRHDAPYSPALTDKTNVNGHFAVSYDGGRTWDMNYSTGLPEDSIPVKMSVAENESGYTFAVATFNNGFYISTDSGRTFTSISSDMDSYNGFIWGEDVILSGNTIYCLTAYYNFGEVSPSVLYEYDITTKTTKKIDLGDIVIARSLTEDTDGILINTVSYYEYAWYNEYATGFWKNSGGGIYRLNADNTLTNIFDITKTYTIDSVNKNEWDITLDGKTYAPGEKVYIENAVLENGDSIYNSVVTDDGTIYATGVYGTVYVKTSTDDGFRVYTDGLLPMLKNISVSSDGKTLYVTSFGGGTYRISSLKATGEETETTTEPTTEPTTETTTETTTEPTTKEQTTETTTETTTEPENKTKCDCICHKDGIYGFFYKIFRFFWKLFGTNKECSCGAMHY